MKKAISFFAIVLYVFLLSVQVFAAPVEGALIEIEDEEIPLANIDTVLDGTNSTAVVTEEVFLREAASASGNVRFKAVTGKLDLESIEIRIEHSAAIRMAEEGKPVTIITELGQFTMDAALLETIAAIDSDVTLTARSSAPIADLEENVDADMSVYILTLTDATGEEIDFGGGAMTVTLPWDGKSTKVAYLDDGNGDQMVEVDDTVFKRGYVTFTTTHFTTWILYFETLASDSGRYASTLVGVGLCAAVLVLTQIGKAIRRGNI